MIETIYIELPFEKIDYLDRPEFYQEGEKKIKEALTQSMKKYGMKDPVYCWANGKAYGDIIKVIVGNNRMVVAKELGIKIIPAVITNFKADTLPIEGRVLNTDAEIREPSSRPFSSMTNRSHSISASTSPRIERTRHSLIVPFRQTPCPTLN